MKNCRTNATTAVIELARLHAARRQYRAARAVLQFAVRREVERVRREIGKSATLRETRGYRDTPGLVNFDALAAEAGWDVRDPRGKSARVFAPGSRARMRREKKWHEKIENERTIRNVVTGVIGAGALAGGFAWGWRRRAAAFPKTGRVKRRVDGEIATRRPSEPTNVVPISGAAQG